jgi:hypothetical protein
VSTLNRLCQIETQRSKSLLRVQPFTGKVPAKTDPLLVSGTGKYMTCSQMCQKRLRVKMCHYGDIGHLAQNLCGKLGRWVLISVQNYKVKTRFHAYAC